MGQGPCKGPGILGAIPGPRGGGVVLEADPGCGDSAEHRADPGD